jgi:hypothetical protein
MIDTQLLHINLEQLKKQEINGDQKKKKGKKFSSLSEEPGIKLKQKAGICHHKNLD